METQLKWIEIKLVKSKAICLVHICYKQIRNTWGNNTSQETIYAVRKGFRNEQLTATLIKKNTNRGIQKNSNRTQKIPLRTEQNEKNGVLKVYVYAFNHVAPFAIRLGQFE